MDVECSAEEFAEEAARAAWLRGVEADARGDMAVAYVCFRTACDLRPTDEKARRRFGVVCLAAGRVEEALEAFYLLCEADRGSADYWSLAAFTLALMGEFEDSVRAYRLSVECGCADAGQYLNLGSMYLGRGMYREAEEVLTEAVCMWPDYPGAHYKLGLARQGVGNAVGALASYGRAAGLNGGWGEAHYRHGSMCEEIGCLAEAMSAYAKAVAVSPADVRYRERMAGVCDRLGRHEQAEEHRSVIRLLAPGVGEGLRAA